MRDRKNYKSSSPSARTGEIRGIKGDSLKTDKFVVFGERLLLISFESIPPGNFQQPDTVWPRHRFFDVAWPPFSAHCWRREKVVAGYSDYVGSSGITRPGIRGRSAWEQGRGGDVRRH